MLRRMSLPFIAGDIAPIVKSDTTVVDFGAIYVGGAGDVAVIPWRGDQHLAESTPAVTFKAVPVGSFLPVRVRRILSTGTTATLMLGLNP